MLKMFVVSDEMFERVIARAREIAEEQYRRMDFDTGMKPEIADQLREQVVMSLAERIVSGWADQLAELDQAAQLAELDQTSAEK